MRNKKIKVFIIAGEVSGDVLGARIMSQMAKTADFVGVGGENMSGVGLQSIFPMSDLSVMGIIEVLGHARTLARRVRQTADAIIQTQPDMVLTIDSPGFARSVISRLRHTSGGQRLIASGLRFHHFVAPQVWAWRPGRAKKYAKTFDKLYAFFDFEIPYFTKYGLDTIAVGHPLADKLIGKYENAPVGADKVITLIPGSRMTEVTKLLPVFHDFVDMLVAKGGKYKFVIPTVETTASYVRQNTKNWAVRPALVSADTRYELYEKTYIAVAASGTVSAELAMIHTPAIVVYKMNRVTTFIGRLLINVRWVSLVNILLNRSVYTECLGGDASAQEIMRAFDKLNTAHARKKMIADLKSADVLWRHNDTDATTIIANDIVQTLKK